jgi:hypothetical protein
MEEVRDMTWDEVASWMELAVTLSDEEQEAARGAAGR